MEDFPLLQMQKKKEKKGSLGLGLGKALRLAECVVYLRKPIKRIRGRFSVPFADVGTTVPSSPYLENKTTDSKHSLSVFLRF